jgi:hypothetical protein
MCGGAQSPQPAAPRADRAFHTPDESGDHELVVRRLLLYVPPVINSPRVAVYSFEVKYNPTNTGNLKPINGRPIYSHGTFPKAVQPNLSFAAVEIDTVYEPAISELRGGCR